MTSVERDFDVIVVGAGISGLYQLHLLRRAGLSFRVFEAGQDVGGTWYWNRYPGARLDSESYTYQFEFADELLDTWDWSETFAAQPELESYYQAVAERYDMRRDIEFNARVTSMVFDPTRDDWRVTLASGDSYVAHLVITATGVLSAPVYPPLPGIDTFRGESFHTALWPREAVSFDDKRVAVIGTGATGIQVITEVARSAAHLTVLQRTPNWAIPLRNAPITAQQMAEIRADYPAMFNHLRGTFSGFIHDADPVPTTAYDDEALRQRFERTWAQPGFAKSVGLPVDVATDPAANRRYCDFLAEKIRERVHDPDTAALLIPDDHYFGSKRVPGEIAYFEVFNQDNVDLVSLRHSPVLEITETGLRTADGVIEVDMIIYATGFDNFVGALKRIDICGVDGHVLAEDWADAPSTYLGVQVAGFPNLFIMGGPHGKGGHGNGPRCAQPVQEWMADFAQWIFATGVRRVEPDPRAQLEWTQHVVDVAEHSLIARTKSRFFFGEDVPGKPRTYIAYLGSLPEFVQRLRDIAADGYRGFVVTR